MAKKKSDKKAPPSAPAPSAPASSAPAGAGQNGNGPAINVLVQYVKDFSFENPNAPQTLNAGPKNPSIQVNINVNARKIGDAEYEVELELGAEAIEDKTVIFKTELVYAGIMRVQNIPEESIQSVILVECPRILFPFARQIIAEATSNGGYPPLLLEPIDFGALYQQNLMKNSQGKPTN